MPDNYAPMGAVPDFYSQLLNSAQQQLVRMPDGSLQQAPQYAQPSSVQQMYSGIYQAPSSPSLASRSVQTVQIDPTTGNPILAQGSAGSDRLPTGSAYLDAPGMGGVSPSVLAYGAPGKNYGTGPQMAVDGSAALTAATNEGMPLPRTDPRGYMTWQDAVTGPGVPGSDPWAGQRGPMLAPMPVTPGLVSGPRPVGMAVPRSPGSNGPGMLAGPPVRIASGKLVPVGTMGTSQNGRYTYQVQPNGSILNITTGSVSAPAPAPKPAPVASAPGNNFLANRGVSTSGMSAGQQANALAAALSGSSQRGSFGV